MTTASVLPAGQRIASREEWLAARTALLTEEKELTRRRDELARRRRELPAVRVEKDYGFDGPLGRTTLAGLFGGRTQLVVYHFMFGPDWAEGCPSCSFVADHLDGMLPHLAARDVALAAVARAPLPKIEAFRRRMGWRFPFVSAAGTDFNYDFRVSFTAEERAGGTVRYNFADQEFPSAEAPGVSTFCRDAEGAVFHTYSAYARGVEPLVGTYAVLDLVPKGRDEAGLDFSMAWVRHHDRYGTDVFLDPTKPYWPAAAPDATAAPPAATGCGCGAKETRA
jgi:predicted dithiol-disulfide oxidoreductase (DUF899 family)